MALGEVVAVVLASPLETVAASLASLLETVAVILASLLETVAMTLASLETAVILVGLAARLPPSQLSAASPSPFASP